MDNSDFSNSNKLGRYKTSVKRTEYSFSNVSKDNRQLYIFTSPSGKRILTTNINKTGDSYQLVDCFHDGVLELNEDIDEIDSRLFYTNYNINGYPVREIKKIIINSNRPVKIGENAFSYCDYLKSVEINCPNSVKVGVEAFNKCIGLEEVKFNSNSEAFEEVSIGVSAFSGCRSLRDISISKTSRMNFDTESFANCESLEEFNNEIRLLILGDFCFRNCLNLKYFKFPELLSAIGQSFYGCDSLKDVYVSDIGDLVIPGEIGYEEVFNKTNIIVSKAKVSQLLKLQKYDYFIIENLVLDNIDYEGIKDLNSILSIYPKSTFKKITVGDFEIDLKILDLDHPINNSVELINYMKMSNDAINTLKTLDLSYDEGSDFLKGFSDKYNRAAIEKNVSYFRTMKRCASSINVVFLASPKLLEIDFDDVLTNIEIIRSNSTVTDNDIRIYYFDDNDLTIDLDNPDSIKDYLDHYIEKHDKLPIALNSLFCGRSQEEIIERVDRLNYVTTMHLAGREKDEYLCKDSVDIIKSVDDETFNSIFGDYKDRASKTNSKLPYLQGIKTLVYEKLKGYIYQDDDENILFDEVFDAAINNFNNTFVGKKILDYYYDMSTYLRGENAKQLEYMKNIICGRVLYTIISRIKSSYKEPITEEYIREKLFDFKNIRSKIILSPDDLFSNYLDSVDDPECIEILLKIDPYAFDMFRNHSGKIDFSIKEQLDDLIPQSNNIQGQLFDYTDLRESETISRFLIPESIICNNILLGYDDVRYYRIAKASGYRFTREEDIYYEEKIKDFNRQLDEVINDPKYAQYKRQLEIYRIEEVNTKPDIMRVFYEFLQNQVVPSNIPINKRHDFEDRVKVLVNEYIEGSSKEGTRLSKIIYSVDMLYRTNNPSILFKSTEEIVENPILISNPDIKDIEKIGIALVALNKMAHQQIDDFIPSDYLTRYRYNSTELMTQSKEFANNVVDALTLLGRYNDIEFTYKDLFREEGVLKNSRFYDYVDNGEYEKVYLLDLDKTKADEIYDFVVSNYREFRKIFKGRNDKNVPLNIKDYYRDNKDIVDYIFKNSTEDEDNMIIAHVNPLILSSDEKTKIYNNFTRWVDYYDDSREITDDREFSVEDYIRIFRSLKKIRDSYKEKPDEVDHLIDNAISQRNMYDLKNRFSEILMNSLIDELGNTSSKDSVDIMNRIINFTKDEKLEMFKNSGIIVEIQEDVLNPGQDVLVVYSKNVREPYSIHLTGKVIKDDDTRKRVRENQIIINSQLDNKNLTYNNSAYSYDFRNQRIDLDFNFKGGDLGRPNALLLNFLTVEIPTLLKSYGITREYLSDILNNNKETDNTIINGIIKMISNLKDKHILQIPEDLDISPEFEYLKGIKFSGINSRYIYTIMGLLGNDRIKYIETKENQKLLNEIVDSYNERLDPNNSDYQDRLKDVFMELSVLHERELNGGTTNKVCYFGDGTFKFIISQNKAFNTLHKINKEVDMSLINDDNYRKIVEAYIVRVCFKRVGEFKSSEDSINELKRVLNDINNGVYTCDNYKIKAFNLSDIFKKEMIDKIKEKIRLLSEGLKIVQKDKSKDLVEMLEESKEEMSTSDQDTHGSEKK